MSETIRNEFQRLFERVFVKLDELGADSAATRATLEEVAKRVDRDADTMSAMVRNHDERLALIERSYVPRSEHESDVAELKARADAIDMQGRTAQLSLAKITGACSLAAALATAVVQAITRML